MSDAALDLLRDAAKAAETLLLNWRDDLANRVAAGEGNEAWQAESRRQINHLGHVCREIERGLKVTDPTRAARREPRS